LSVLTTSQLALGLEAEAVFVVGPLSLLNQEETASSDAYALFMDRAGWPGGTGAQPGSDPIAEICRRLDGLPLAIELAAALTGAMSAADIADHLDDRFALLGRPTDAGPSVRHHSLQAALDWSYELLDTSRQALLRRMSVFAGGATLPAIEAVAAGADLPIDAVATALDDLAARSLVMVNSGSPPRYGLLETIRMFGSERLEEASEVDDHQAGHGAWFVAMAEEAEPQLTGPGQQEWMDALEADHDNLRAALAWALAHDDHELAQRLAGSLTLFWRVRGHMREGLYWFDRLLEASEGDASSEPTPSRAKALWGAGFLHHMLMHNSAAVPLLEKALAAQRAAGDERGASRSLLILADCLAALASPTEGLPFLEESAALARRAGDTWCLVHALSTTAYIRHSLGDMVTGRLLHEEAVSLARAGGDAQSLAFATNGFGHFSLSQGDFDAADNLLTEALELVRAMGETHGESMILSSLGYVAQEQGRYDLASSRFHEARDLAERSAGRLEDSLVPVVSLAALAIATGDLAGAEAMFREAQPMLARLGRPQPFALLPMAALARASGDQERAAALLAEAQVASRVQGNVVEMANVDQALAGLARAEGRWEDAATLLHRALALLEEGGDKPGLVGSLEALAGLATETRRNEYAARLFGAAESLRASYGYPRYPAAEAEYQADVARLGASCESGALEEWWAQGGRLFLEAAVAYAGRGRGAREPEVEGWESLSPAESEVAESVGRGLTNPEIAKELLMSVNTVKVHLKRIFQKLGVESRYELRERSRQRNTHSG